MRVTVVLPVLAPKGVSNTAPSAGKVSMVICAGSPPIFSLNARLSKNGPRAFSLSSLVVNFEEQMQYASVGGGTVGGEPMHSASWLRSVTSCLLSSLIFFSNRWLVLRRSVLEFELQVVEIGLHPVNFVLDALACLRNGA